MELALCRVTRMWQFPPHASPMSPSPTDRFSMGSPAFAKTPTPSAPRDIKRYFVSQQDAGHLCVMSCLWAPTGIFSSQGRRHNESSSFARDCFGVSELNGYTPIECGSEDEARARTDELIAKKQWPCFFLTVTPRVKSRLRNFTLKVMKSTGTDFRQLV